ncbi:MAG: DUF503 domain-containing protein [Acidobacteria bacterium]|nr:DUF503 domain-containing protein [Acidobacteriota bacterium]MBI3657312.1 DUF503 domain-containing protein [Acidobacteriota bacterium]
MPYAHSLKEKRMIVQKVQSRLRARFNFSLAEIEHQDLWQRAKIGAVTISGDRSTLDRVVQHFIHEAERILGGDLIDCQVEIIE